MSKGLNTLTFGLAGEDKSDREKARDRVRRGIDPDPETGAISRNVPFPGEPGDPRHKAKLAAQSRAPAGRRGRGRGRGIDSFVGSRTQPVDIRTGRRGTFTAPLTEEAVAEVRRRGRRRAPTVIDLERISTLG